jgi:signal peptidase complex subunit 2
MAAKKKSTGKVEAVNAVPVTQDDDDDDKVEEDEVELLQVDVGDMIKLKQILDETVAAAVLEHVDEDYRLDNFKLGIMTAACAFACGAQFAPVPFPDSRPILGVCCCVYFLFSGLLQFITTFVDKDCILLTKKKVTSENANLQTYGLRVRSTLPRFSEFYTVILEFQKMPGTPRVEQKWSVGQFFDVEGMFDEAGLMIEISSLVKRLEAEKYESSAPVLANKKKKAD